MIYEFCDEKLALHADGFCTGALLPTSAPANRYRGGKVFAVNARTLSTVAS